MQPIKCWTTAAIIVIATVGLVWQPAQANPVVQAHCAQTTLQGPYEFLAPATVVVSPGTTIALPEEFLATSPAAYASQGQVYFEANGAVVLLATHDLQGEFAEPIAYIGDYVVNADCTAVVQLEQGSRFSIRLVQTATAQRLVSTTPGFVLIPHESGELVAL